MISTYAAKVIKKMMQGWSHDQYIKLCHGLDLIRSHPTKQKTLNATAFGDLNIGDVVSANSPGKYYLAGFRKVHKTDFVLKKRYLKIGVI